MQDSNREVSLCQKCSLCICRWSKLVVDSHVDASLVLQVPCGANRAQTKNKIIISSSATSFPLPVLFYFIFWQINRFTRLHLLTSF